MEAKSLAVILAIAYRCNDVNVDIARNVAQAGMCEHKCAYMYTVYNKVTEDVRDYCTVGARELVRAQLSMGINRIKAELSAISTKIELGRKKQGEIRANIAALEKQFMEIGRVISEYEAMIAKHVSRLTACGKFIETLDEYKE